MTTLDIDRTAAPRSGPTPASRLTGWSGRTIVAVLLAVFALFFVIPIVWLLLATTKSATELIADNPLRPGSLGGLTGNWRALFDFQDGAVVRWVSNSALYAVGALVITLVASIPAG